MRKYGIQNFLWIQCSKYLFILNRGHAVHDKLDGYSIWGAVVSEVEVDLLTGKEFKIVVKYTVDVYSLVTAGL